MEGVASDIGTRSMVKNKEIGEDSAANLILGALGGGATGAGGSDGGNFALGKRSGEYAQESAKTDGMSKGGHVGAGGSDGDIFSKLKRSGEYAQESAKTDGLCK